MCTLIVLHRRVSGAPLLVAANRDEYLARPAEPPALRSLDGTRALAPRDVQAGGTWLGLAESGLFAAVTNRPCAAPDPARRSRGHLVHEALRAPSAAEAADRLATLPAGAYNPFNLFVADRHEAFVVTYSEKPRAAALEPGVHVIGNADPLGPPTPKLRRLSAAAARAAEAPAAQVPAELARVCRSHAEHADPLRSACVHTSAYGTRSSTLLRLSDDPAEGFFRFAEGAPCETDYRDFTPLLHALAGGRQRDEGAARARSDR